MKGGYNTREVAELAKECILLSKSAELASLKAKEIIDALRWESIDSAPRRGDYISVCIGYDNFDSERKYFPETVKWEHSSWVDKNGAPIDYEPTHWIALPMPPVR